MAVQIDEARLAKPTILDAAAEADRRGYGRLRKGGFIDGAAIYLDNVVGLPIPSLRSLGWRRDGFEWARRAMLAFETAQRAAGEAA